MSVPLFQSVNMFLGLREQNVVFCLDISGSMYNSLNAIKEHLIQYLLEQSVLANLNLNRMFNLVAFSSEIYPWADRLVLWNSATVNSAINWIKDLETKTGTNTLDALMTAFQDTECNSVVLVTDDLPDQDAYTILNQISLTSRGRPVHCIYIQNGRDEDRPAVQFLQNLATVTRGTLKLVSIGRHGVEKITPLNHYDLTSTFQLANLSINANSAPAQIDTKTTIDSQNGYVANITPGGLTYLPFEVKNTHVISKYQPASLLPSFTYPKWLVEPSNYSYPSFLKYPRVMRTNDGKLPTNSIAWSRFRPVKVLYDGTVVGLTCQDSNLPVSEDIAYTPDAGALLLNRTVCARSSLDGYYYIGKVINQVLAHRFTIQFGPSTHGKYRDCFYQDTAIYDIIHFDDAIRHPIRANDKVLAPYDGVEKYAPAEVIDGFEKRDSTDERDRGSANKPITVRFADGKTRTLSDHQAIWLPDAMYERVKFELNLPSNARKYLEEFSDDYPYKSLLSCYPTSTKLTEKTIESVVMPRMVYDIWPYFVPFYPIYSKLLYPAQNLAPQFRAELDFQLPAMSATPTYFRQIRCNQPVVSAECVNQSVIGSALTPNQLDEKIRQQIKKHQHLLRRSMKSREQSPECCVGCRCQNNGPPKETSPPKNNPSHHGFSHYPTTCPMDNHDNKHYQFYQNMIQSLYDSARQETMPTRRSKSVTFFNTPDQTHCHCAVKDDHDDYDDLDGYEVVCYGDKEFRKSISTNTDVSFAKREHRPAQKKSTAFKLEDRFGNPKVSIGMPGRPLHRSQSALETLDYSIAYENNSKEKYRREKSAEREKARQDKLMYEQKKQDLRDQYHRSVSTQNSQFEMQRAENLELRKQEAENARKEANFNYRKNFENNKVDIESKEKRKYDHLRNENLKRNENRMSQLQNEALKEANKIGFKQVEQNQRNQLYHDRVLFEEAVRKTYQSQALLSHNKNMSKEKSREKAALKEAALNQSVKENRMARRTNEFLKFKN